MATEAQTITFVTDTVTRGVRLCERTERSERLPGDYLLDPVVKQSPHWLRTKKVLNEKRLLSIGCVMHRSLQT